MPRRRVGHVLLLCILFAAACGTDNDRLDVATTSTTDAGPVLTAPPQPLECEVKGYPCTPADVPEEIHDRADQLGDEVVAMFDAGSTVAEADAWLRSQPGVAEVESEGPALWFRLEGGRGNWVLRDEAFGHLTRSAGHAQREPVGALVDHRPMTATPRFRVVGAGAQKRALVLSPMLLEFGASDEGQQVAQILTSTRGYEGGVTYAANATADSDDVTIESFKQFGSYDVVHLITHGFTICIQSCRTGVVSNIIEGDKPDEPGVYTRDELKRMKENGVEFAKVGGTRGFVLVTRDYLILTADFFRTYYPGGLDNTFIFFNTCRTLTPQSTDVADALRGSTSVFVGWDGFVVSIDAHDAGLKMYEYLAERGHTAEHAYDMLGPLRVDRRGTEMEIATRAAGGDLRIREVVYLLSPGSDVVLTSAAAVRIEGEISDGEDDVVPYGVRVDGIADRHAGDAELHVVIDGKEAQPEVMSDWAADDEGRRTVEGKIDLEYDLEEDHKEVQFEAWVELPSTGRSRHSTPAFLTGEDTCVVGTWRVNNQDVLELHGFTVGEAAEEAYAEGTVTASFRADGTVTYRFDGWRVGNTVFTPSPIPGGIADLHGDVYTSSNGTARGNWRIENPNLVLLVGEFDTTVVQRVIDPILEINSTIDADPHLARLYIIPNGSVRYVCGPNQLAVEWSDGNGVRWFRVSGTPDSADSKNPKSHKG